MIADELELEAACEANDIARVRELFATRPLNNDDATKRRSSSASVPLMRCLLEHGADLDLCVKAPRSLDMVKLFVEFGFDVKAGGHMMLQ